MAKRPRNRGPKPWARKGYDQLEGRNIVLEALEREVRPVVRIVMDQRTKPHPKINRIVNLANKRDIPVFETSREELDLASITGVHNGIMAEAETLPDWTVTARLNHCISMGVHPFFVLVDEVNYEHNLGAILRSAMGAGVHAVVIPTRRGKGVTAVVQRVAMGGAEEVPVIREGIPASLKVLKRAGVRIVGADMDGANLWDVPMDGPLAIVLGGEDKGVTHTIRDRCDAIVSVPLAHGLDSLNVSVTAGILMYEKVRQSR
jgi:23S rRNA (guanosine2251-2'-O)-methyltransferase